MLLKVNNVYKEYSRGIRVLNNINMKIDYGEIVGIVGLNGAGKSTLMRLISGVTGFQDGEIEFEGTSINKLNVQERRKIAYLCAGNNLYGELSVHQNLEIFRCFYDASKNELNKTIVKLSLDSIIDKKIMHLSTGMRQRVAIACTTMGQPKLILLDEPTAALDIEIKSKIIQYIKSISESKTGIMITSHNVKDIEDLCNRVYILRNGCIYKESTVPNLLMEASSNKQLWKINVKVSHDNAMEEIINQYEVQYNSEYVSVYVDDKDKKKLLRDLSNFDIISVTSSICNLEDAIMGIVTKGDE